MSNMTTMSSFSWPAAKIQHTIIARHEPSHFASPGPQPAKDNHVLLAVGLAAAATALIVLFTFGFIFLKRYMRRKAKGKGRARIVPDADAPIEMVDLEARPSIPPTRSPYPEKSGEWPSGNIGTSRVRSCSIGEPSRTYASPAHRYPCDDIDQVAHYQRVIKDGNREFVEVSLGFAKGKGKCALGTGVLDDNRSEGKVWWG
jgi:hypothetical protein